MEKYGPKVQIVCIQKFEKFENYDQNFQNIIKVEKYGQKFQIQKF